MDARQTVETLIKLGVHMKAAASKHSLATGKGLVDFLASPSAKQVELDVSALLTQLTIGDIQQAVQQVRAKQQDFLKGRKIIDLPVAELRELHALVDVENALVLKEVDKIGTVSFWSWLVNDALPILVTVAKIVIPILV